MSKWQNNCRKMERIGKYLKYFEKCVDKMRWLYYTKINNRRENLKTIFHSIQKNKVQRRREQKSTEEKVAIHLRKSLKTLQYHSTYEKVEKYKR